MCKHSHVDRKKHEMMSMDVFFIDHEYRLARIVTIIVSFFEYGAPHGSPHGLL